MVAPAGFRTPVCDRGSSRRLGHPTCPAHNRHWVEAVAERPTSGILLDFRGIEHLELSDDDVFRAVTAKRRRLPQQPDFRFVIIAPSQYLKRLSDEFVQVRDPVAGDSEDVPAVRPFDEPAEADAWLGEGRSD